MTESTYDVLATDRLVTALAERRPLDSTDPAVAALSALCSEVDREPIPAGDLLVPPHAVPFVRRVGVAAAAVGVLAFASSGVAAAVTGDPLLPLRYVVGKLYEQAHPEPQPDADRFLLGDTRAAEDGPDLGPEASPADSVIAPRWEQAVDESGSQDGRWSASQGGRSDPTLDGAPGTPRSAVDDRSAERPDVDDAEAPVGPAPDEPSSPADDDVPAETAPTGSETADPDDHVVMTDPDDTGGDQQPSGDDATPTEPPADGSTEPEPTDPPGDGRGRSGDHVPAGEDSADGTRPGRQSPGRPVDDSPVPQRRLPGSAAQPPADSTVDSTTAAADGSG